MPKKPANNGAKVQARVKRAETAIEQILKQEEVIITASRIRVLFPDKDGKYIGGDVISVRGLARFCKLPEGTLLFPQVQIEARQAPPEVKPA